MNIYQKLLQVSKNITAVGKSGKVAFGSTKFDYASSSDVLRLVRPHLNDVGLFITTEITDQQVEITKSGYLTKLSMVFTITNTDAPDEQIKTTWFAQGIDNSEKGIGKALTYAEKYYLLKTFNLPTDADDAELHDQLNYFKEQNQAKQPAPDKVTPINKNQPDQTQPHPDEQILKWFHSKTKNCKDKKSLYKAVGDLKKQNDAKNTGDKHKHIDNIIKHEAQIRLEAIAADYYHDLFDEIKTGKSLDEAAPHAKQAVEHSIEMFDRDMTDLAWYKHLYQMAAARIAG